MKWTSYLIISESGFSRNDAYNGLYKKGFLRNSATVDANILSEEGVGG